MKTITLNDQQVEFLKTLIDETIFDDDGFDTTTKTVAQQIITKLEE